MFGLSETSTILQSTHKGFIQRNFSKKRLCLLFMACGVLQVYWCSDGLGNVGIEVFTYHHFLLVGARF
jgi:hypothetical protein